MIGIRFGTDGFYSIYHDLRRKNRKQLKIYNKIFNLISVDSPHSARMELSPDYLAKNKT